jgi:hypothetical protein
VDRGPTPK